jgi:hypothetical protein
MTKKRADWQVLAKAEYVTGKDVSIRDIALKFGKGYAWVRQVAMKEGWTKEKAERWNNAEKEALEEAEGSIKDLIKRHSRVARYLQAGGLKNLKLILDEVEDLMKVQDIDGARKLLKSLIYNKIISPATLTVMVAEGLKAERELYPKQMQIEGDVEVRYGEVSDELKEAAHDALIKRITKKPRGSNKNS